MCLLSPGGGIRQTVGTHYTAVIIIIAIVIIIIIIIGIIMMMISIDIVIKEIYIFSQQV